MANVINPVPTGATLKVTKGSEDGMQTRVIESTDDIVKFELI